LDNGEFTIIPFEQARADGVSALFVTINRELAPAGMEDAFEGRPPTPICKLVDFFFEELGDGRAVMVLQPSEAHYNPIGSIYGGIIATVLDSVMGCAMHTKLPVGSAYTTLRSR
jgi:acyl-coenzyme A thioesterase PaaI-like protein